MLGVVTDASRHVERQHNIRSLSTRTGARGPGKPRSTGAAVARHAVDTGGPSGTVGRRAAVVDVVAEQVDGPVLGP